MINEKNTLLIDTSPAADCLVSPNGEPVWSVKNADELKSLRSITRIFNSTLQDISGQGGESCVVEEDVVGLGDGIDQAGRLYAHLTGRNYRLAKSLDEIADGNFPAVLITKPHLLDNELLKLLYSSGKDKRQMTGIICADDPHLLRKQVLVRAAASHLSGKPESSRIDFFPLHSFETRKMSGYEVYSGQSSPAEIRAALRRGTGILSISTHADGVDSFFGKDLTLCPMADIQTPPESALTPVCQTTQFCHRHKVPMEEFLQSDNLLSPTEIAARILVFNNCFGLLLPSSIVDVGWSLGQFFFNSDKLGAVLTTWGLTITNSSQPEKLVQNLLTGMPIGQALAAYENSDEAKRFGGHRICLLGDPRVRLPKAEPNWIESAKPRFFKNRFKEAPETKDLHRVRQGDFDFFESCFNNLSKNLSDEPRLKEIRAILSKVEDCRRLTSAEGNLEKNDNPSAVEMRNSILNFILSQTQLHHAWIGIVEEFILSVSSDTCGLCKQSFNVYDTLLRGSEKVRRRLTTCPNCGILEDSPAAINLEMSIEDDTIVLSGNLPQKYCTAGVLVASTDIESVQWKWQTDETGYLLRSFQIPGFKSSSFVRVHVILVWNDDYVMLTQLTRSFQEAKQD